MAMMLRQLLMAAATKRAAPTAALAAMCVWCVTPLLGLISTNIQSNLHCLVLLCVEIYSLQKQTKPLKSSKSYCGFCWTCLYLGSQFNPSSLWGVLVGRLRKEWEKSDPLCRTLPLLLIGPPEDHSCCGADGDSAAGPSKSDGSTEPLFILECRMLHDDCYRFRFEFELSKHNKFLSGTWDIREYGLYNMYIYIYFFPYLTGEGC
jgi:hypothetical protein